MPNSHNFLCPGVYVRTADSFPTLRTLQLWNDLCAPNVVALDEPNPRFAEAREIVARKEDIVAERKQFSRGDNGYTFNHTKKSCMFYRAHAV